MKLRLLLPTFLLSLLAAGPALNAADNTAASADDSRRTLTVTVVEPVERRSDDDFFNRVARVFTDVFEARHWPVKIAVERFGANQPDYDLELRVFLQKIRQETPGDLTFRAWMNLHENGTKHDFGIITYRHYPRPGRHVDDALDEVVQGAALEAAKKIESVLFPNASSK